VTDLYLVCGGGRTARVAARELQLTGRRFTIIERDPAVCAVLRTLVPPDRVVEGDATDEEVLVRAGIKEARALLALLPGDKLNLVLTVVALQANPSLLVVCRSNDETQWARLRRAGALVVSPAHISGRRLATEMIHPQTSSFLNEMLTAPSPTPTRVEAVEVEGAGAGRTLGEIDPFRRTGLVVFAMTRAGSTEFLLNPPDATRLAAGDRLLVAGPTQSVDALAGPVGRRE
jgi:voltage-gated potassium channel